MGKILVETCDIEGLYIITPTVFGDHRGYFMETYNKEDYVAAGIDVDFVQDNQSASKQGVLRGLHYQTKHAQDKLVRVLKGEVFDVAVDLRSGSKTYGQWFGVLLSEENKKQIFIPRGYGHAFVSLTDNTEIEYKTDNYYSAGHDAVILWSDSDLNINWGIDNPVLSEKDKNAPLLKELLL